MSLSVFSNSTPLISSVGNASTLIAFSSPCVANPINLPNTSESMANWLATLEDFFSFKYGTELTNNLRAAAKLWSTCNLLITGTIAISGNIALKNGTCNECLGLNLKHQKPSSGDVCNHNANLPVLLFNLFPGLYVLLSLLNTSRYFFFNQSG